MALNVIIFIVAVLAIGIWLLFGFKRIKHKLFAIFLIALLLFSFLSFKAVFNGKEISIKSISDLGNMAKLYFSWLGNVFGNMKSLTGEAVKMSWKSNSTA